MEPAPQRVALGTGTCGIGHTTATNAGFITVLYVVFAPLGAAVIARRAPSAVTALCVTLSLIGLGLLSLHGWAFRGGDLLVLGAALVFAAHILAVDRLVGRCDPLALATCRRSPQRSGWASA